MGQVVEGKVVNPVKALRRLLDLKGDEVVEAQVLGGIRIGSGGRVDTLGTCAVKFINYHIGYGAIFAFGKDIMWCLMEYAVCVAIQLVGVISLVSTAIQMRGSWTSIVRTVIVVLGKRF